MQLTNADAIYIRRKKFNFFLKGCCSNDSNCLKKEVSLLILLLLVNFRFYSLCILEGVWKISF